MKKILVTGGAGFVGRHLIQSLLKQGHEVHCVDSLLPLSGAITPNDWPLFNPNDFNNFHFLEQNCRDFFSKNPNEYFDYAYHLAALVGGRLLIEENPLALCQDLAIDASYWNWAQTAKPDKSICFSSSAVYPIKLQEKGSHCSLKESMLNFKQDMGLPDMSYGWAKMTHEYLAQLAYQKHGLKSIVYRPFSGYGEDQDLSYPFPAICLRALTNKDRSKLEVWGSGEQMRDFIHIEDCIRAIIQSVDRIHDASALNLSNGSLISFKNLAANICENVGYKTQIICDKSKPAGVFARKGCTLKQKSLGIKHSINLQTGIKRCLTFLETQNNIKMLAESA